MSRLYAQTKSHAVNILGKNAVYIFSRVKEKLVQHDLHVFLYRISM